MGAIDQDLLWMPEAKSVNGVVTFEAIPLQKGTPFRVWSLCDQRNKNTKPALPYAPKHLKNAFLEDRVHDWLCVNGYLKYYTRVSTGGHWLLLEYKTDKNH